MEGRLILICVLFLCGGLENIFHTLGSHVFALGQLYGLLDVILDDWTFPLSFVTLD